MLLVWSSPDGHLGIWGALCNVYPEAEEQRCWNHSIINILAKGAQTRAAPGLIDSAPDPLC